MVKINFKRRVAEVETAWSLSASGPEVHLVPAFHDLVILDDQKGRSVQRALLAGGGKAQVVAKMGHGDPPANGNTVTLGDYVLDVDVKVRKGPDRKCDGQP